MTATSPGTQALDEVLRAPAEPRRPRDDPLAAAAIGHVHRVLRRLATAVRLERTGRQAARSSSLACRRAATSSSARRRACARARATTSPPASSRTVVRAGSARGSFSIEKWRAASEAICGRCVMQSDLALGGQRAQLLADRARGLAADARVDLVEDERRPRAVAGHAEQGEHHARQLAAGGGLAQRRGGHAGVRRDQELDRVGPGRTGPSRSPSAISNVAPSIASSARRSRTAAASRGAALRPRARAAPARPPTARRARRPARRRRLQRDLGAGQLVAARAAALGVLEHRRDACRRACA